MKIHQYEYMRNNTNLLSFILQIYLSLEIDQKLIKKINEKKNN